MPITEPGTKADEFDFAAELADHAPDLTDDQICEAVDEYVGREPGYLNPRSPVGMVVCACYDGKSVKAGKRVSLMLFGFDITAD